MKKYITQKDEECDTCGKELLRGSYCFIEDGFDDKIYCLECGEEEYDKEF